MSLGLHSALQSFPWGNTWGYQCISSSTFIMHFYSFHFSMLSKMLLISLILPLSSMCLTAETDNYSFKRHLKAAFDLQYYLLEKINWKKRANWHFYAKHALTNWTNIFLYLKILLHYLPVLCCWCVMTKTEINLNMKGVLRPKLAKQMSLHVVVKAGMSSFYKVRTIHLFIFHICLLCSHTASLLLCCSYSFTISFINKFPQRPHVHWPQLLYTLLYSLMVATVL